MDDFEMSSDVTEAVPILGIEKVPICLTMSTVRRSGVIEKESGGSPSSGVGYRVGQQVALTS